MTIPSLKQILADIERTLGRPLDASRRHAIDDLNEVPEDLIEDARKLGTPLTAMDLLDYYITSRNHVFLGPFIERVVFGGESPSKWRRGRILVPSVSIDVQLCTEPSQLLAPMGGESPIRVVPRLESWRAGTGWEGAPARVDPDSHYRTPHAPDTVAALVPTAAVETVTDPVVALRRWIAGCLASVLDGAGRLWSAKDPSDLATPGAPLDRWSADARIAGRALLREIRELGPAGNEIPGFRGPDSWYRGEAATATLEK